MKTSAISANTRVQGGEGMPSVMITNLNKTLWNSLNQAKELALKEAKRSPCLRRKYGAIFYYPNVYVAGHNRRVARCCDGDICIREVMNIQHGHNTDLGAEVHAEQDLFMHHQYEKGMKFLIAGYGKDGQELYGLDCWPCYVCARIIKNSNPTPSVWVPEKDGSFSNYTIDEILEEYTNEILGSLGDF